MICSLSFELLLSCYVTIFPIYPRNQTVKFISHLSLNLEHDGIFSITDLH